MGTASTQVSIFSHVKWEHLAAGVSGGVVSTLSVHPLDLIKIRFQVNEGKAVHVANRPTYNGVLHAFRSIYAESGIRGLYQGATPNTVGAGAAWGFYFFFYNGIKTWMQDGDHSKQLDAGHHMLAAAQSGALTLVMTNPIWVAKTRLCLQYDQLSPSANKNSQVFYKGLFDTLGKIYKAEGVKGWYKGFLPGLFGISHGVLQFMAYEELKNVYCNYKKRPINTKLGTFEYLAFAALSKTFAVSITYPYQVVRSRLQDQHRQYSGALHVIKETWRFEGIVGFYKGLVPNLLRVTPACCITFIIYEKMTSYLMPSKHG